MKLELNNLVYTTDDAVKIERLKELGAVPAEEKPAKKEQK